MTTFYQNIPLHIDPIAFSIGSFSVRWYGVSYLVGFVVVYFILRWRIKHGEFPKNIKLSAVSCQLSLVLDYLLVSFLSALIGGRIGYILFYNAKYFLANPLVIISPYDRGGALIGIFGMSYHGALLGIILGSWIFLKRKKVDFLTWADFVAPAVALGYFFGRLGNFFNGELYGRVTNSFLGMHFLNDPGKLRHPSQIYEAFLEGLLLFAILWSLRNKKMPKGLLLGLYLIGYGMLRIFAEQFREPDSQIGLLLGYFTLGQVLSMIMIFCGAIILFTGFKKNKKML